MLTSVCGCRLALRWGFIERRRIHPANVIEILHTHQSSPSRKQTRRSTYIPDLAPLNLGLTVFFVVLGLALVGGYDVVLGLSNRLTDCLIVCDCAIFDNIHFAQRNVPARALDLPDDLLRFAIQKLCYRLLHPPHVLGHIVNLGRRRLVQICKEGGIERQVLEVEARSKDQVSILLLSGEAMC
jgi:hypothetical protein